MKIDYSHLSMLFQKIMLSVHMKCCELSILDFFNILYSEQILETFRKCIYCFRLTICTKHIAKYRIIYVTRVNNFELAEGELKILYYYKETHKPWSFPISKLFFCKYI